MLQNKPKYEILMSEETLLKILNYKEKLELNPSLSGKYLAENIIQSGKTVHDLNIEEFIEIILSTKLPKIFAESQILGGGEDWNDEELGILGDINIVAPVKVYDNGVWNISDKNFKVYRDKNDNLKPFDAYLMFTPGALLKRSSHEGMKNPPDLVEVLGQNGNIDIEKYEALVQRRLLPLLVYSNENSKERGKKSVITMTGIGASAFAGEFKGKIGEYLNNAMKSILKTYESKLQDITCIHYDPHSACKDEQENFGKIQYRVRPLEKSKYPKSQLSSLKNLQEARQNFKKCILYKKVAWDHVSWPGNDYFGGIRNTDDGVAAAATDMMWVITGIEGRYDPNVGEYLPPLREKKPYMNWEEVVKENKVRLIASGNVKIVTKKAELKSLEQFFSEYNKKILPIQSEHFIKRNVSNKKPFNEVGERNLKANDENLSRKVSLRDEKSNNSSEPGNEGKFFFGIMGGLCGFVIAYLKHKTLSESARSSMPNLLFDTKFLVGSITIFGALMGVSVGALLDKMLSIKDHKSR